MADKRVQIDLGINPPSGAASVFQELAAKAEAAERKTAALRSSTAGAGAALEQFGKTGVQGVNRLNESVGKLQSGISLLSGAVPQLAGVQGVLATISGTGGLASSLGLASIGATFAAIAAGVTAIGAAAVIASPRLADSLGKAFDEVSGKAEAARESIKRLQEQRQQIFLSQAWGVGLLEREERQQRGAAIQQPFDERRRRLEITSAEAMTRAEAIRLFPEPPLDLRRRAVTEAQERLQIALGSPTLAGLGGATEEFAGTIGFRPRAGALADRETMQARQSADNAQQELLDAQRKFRDFDRRLSLTQERGRLGREAEAAQQQLEALAPGNQPFFRSIRQTFGYDRQGAAGLGIRRAELGGQIADLSFRRAEIDAQLGPAGQTTAEEGARIRQRLREAEDRNEQAQQRNMAARLAAGKAIVDQLKEQHALVESQVKGVQQLIRQEEQRQKQIKAQLGVMDPLETMAAIQAVKKVQGNQELSKEEMQLLGRLPGGEEFYNKAATAQFERSPLSRELFQLLGVEQRAGQLRKTEQQLIEVQGKVETALKVEIQQNEELERSLVRAVIPGIKAALEDLVKGLAQAIRQEIGLQKLQQLAAQQAEQRGAR